MRQGRKHGFLWYLFVFVLFCVSLPIVAVAGINAIVILSTQGDIVSVQQAASFQADYIVVPGASVLPDGTPSDALKARLDKAVELYREGAAPRIVMSGDDSDEYYNEPRDMKAYVVKKGVPNDDVLCDTAGLSTYESMYSIANSFGAGRIIVATQQYQLHRALFAAKGWNVEVEGVSCGDGDSRWFDKREIVARIKDFLQTMSRTNPAQENSLLRLERLEAITEAQEKAEQGETLVCDRLAV